MFIKLIFRLMNKFSTKANLKNLELLFLLFICSSVVQPFIFSDHVNLYENYTNSIRILYICYTIVKFRCSESYRN